MSERVFEQANQLHGEGLIETVAGPPAPAAVLGADERPPGERYYRHPGDVLRLIVWGAATFLLLALVELAPAATAGLRTDLVDIGDALPLALRQLALASVQVAAVAVPLTIVALLVAGRRWRRSATIACAAALGALLGVLAGSLVDTPVRLAGALDDDAWLTSARFPSPTYLAAAVAAGAVAKPWLSRRWRRTVDVAGIGLGVTMAAAGIAGGPEIALAYAVGSVAGAAVLVAVGAPNRRPTPASVVAALGIAGFAITRLDLVRAMGGRSQLYRATAAQGPLFLKVYARDSRDADLLYRAYRTSMLRDAGGAAAASLVGDVEHEALLLLLASRDGVTCPPMRAVVGLPDGAAVLVMTDVGGRRLDELAADEIDGDLLTAVWRETSALHAAGLAHGALRAANVIVNDTGRPVVIDLGAGTSAADSRAQAIDRAELLASLADLVGPGPVIAAAGDAISPGDLAAALPYLQPLALSAATRRATSSSTLRTLREEVGAATASPPVPLERLVRVRLRTVVVIMMLTGAFYVLLPQLANVDDSVDAMRSANWLWLGGAAVMSILTYVAATVGLLGGVREALPFVPTFEVTMASSFVNRVTPANVGGMALNVRYMQKAGIPAPDAVTGVGLNVVAGGIVHVGLLAVFFAWAGRSGSSSFSIPGGSTALVVIAVVLALVGLAMATRWGRSQVRRRVLPTLRQSAAGVFALARSPLRLLALFGGSVGVTLAYIAALSFSSAAFDGGASFADVGAVYLGASLLAAAAPTPGGLGALEAALVAGFTGIGMDPGIAVAVVLSYRLITFWLPILPGWLCFHHLDRRQYI